MRVMVIVKATKDSEAGLSMDAETTAMFEAMGRKELTALYVLGEQF